MAQPTGGLHGTLLAEFSRFMGDLAFVITTRNKSSETKKLKTN
jgi:hypothetical protein